MKNRPDRAHLVHTSEQLVAVLADFVPLLVPMVARQVKEYENEGMSRAEAIELGARLQDTVIRQLMRLGRRKPKE